MDQKTTESKQSLIRLQRLRSTSDGPDLIGTGHISDSFSDQKPANCRRGKSRQLCPEQTETTDGQTQYMTSETRTVRHLDRSENTDTGQTPDPCRTAGSARRLEPRRGLETSRAEGRPILGRCRKAPFRHQRHLPERKEAPTSSSTSTPRRRNRSPKKGQRKQKSNQEASPKSEAARRRPRTPR